MPQERESGNDSGKHFDVFYFAFSQGKIKWAPLNISRHPFPKKLHGEFLGNMTFGSAHFG